MYHVARLPGGELVGAAGTRGNAHLYHLFVARHAQGRGLGRMLWATALGACIDGGNPGRMTVNASPNATGFYERLGSLRTGETMNVGGVIAVPMRWERGR